MPRKSKTDQEIGYLRAMWEELDDIEREYGRVLIVSVIKTNQKGVFNFRISATSADDTASEVPRTDTIQQRFPEARTTTLAGFWWSLAQRLNDQVANVEEARQAETKG